MKTLKFWIPVFISLLATPCFLLLGILSGGAGHGTYFLTKILFPFTMISAIIFGTITMPFILLAVAQFPLYGVAFGIANIKGKLIPLAVGLFSLHVAAAGLCLLTGQNF